MYMSKKQKTDIAELIKSYTLFNRLYIEELFKEPEDVNYQTLESWKRLTKRQVDSLAEYGIYVED